ncbi:putative peptide permease protein BMEII0860, partial [Dissostichus eleginoides]
MHCKEVSNSSLISPIPCYEICHRVPGGVSSTSGQSCCLAPSKMLGHSEPWGEHRPEIVAGLVPKTPRPPESRPSCNAVILPSRSQIRVPCHQPNAPILHAGSNAEVLMASVKRGSHPQWEKETVFVFGCSSGAPRTQSTGLWPFSKRDHLSPELGLATPAFSAMVGQNWTCRVDAAQQASRIKPAPISISTHPPSACCLPCNLQSNDSSELSQEQRERKQGEEGRDELIEANDLMRYSYEAGDGTLFTFQRGSEASSKHSPGKLRIPPPVANLQTSTEAFNTLQRTRGAVDLLHIDR